MAATEKGAKARAGKGPEVPQAVTANRLADGLVVFLANGERWVEHVNEAQLARGKTASDALLALAEADAARCIVVAPYLIEITETPGGPAPAALRERIRAAGPTIRPNLGTQAE